MTDNKMLLLVIDDSKLSRNLLKHYVLSEYDDMEIIEEGGAKKGLEAYYGKKPHLTFLDLTMPEMSGFDFLEEIKKRGKHGKIAVLSADVQEISRSTAISLGADTFINKPIKAQLSAINRIIDSVRADLRLTGLDLTDDQKDGIEEIINIGIGTAAAALSKLTGEKIKLAVPVVEIMESAAIEKHLRQNYPIKESIVTLQQSFKGGIHGSALLLFDRPDVKKLVDLMLGDETIAEDDVEAYKDSILEIGNILLSACVGALGNTIEMPISFVPPKIHSNGLTLMERNDDFTLLRYAMVAQATFNVQERKIEGFLVIIISISSMKRLLASIEKFFKTK